MGWKRVASALPLLVAAACAHTPQQSPTARHSPTAASPAYAWVTFDRTGIRDSGAFGLADRQAGRPITIGDPVRIASITKLVVALGAMRLVEQGVLDLDRDFSDYLGWRLRNPAFPNAPITLRMLLSHTSSLRDGIDYAIPLGGSVQDALGDFAAFDAEHPPGVRYFTYSNLNFPVIASAMEAVTGERFDRLMERLVLDPLELDACFNWTTCSDEAVERAVVLYDTDGSVLRDDLGGEWPECPVVPAADGGCDVAGYRPGANGALFSPQGGLRISARDLATLGRLLLNQGSWNGRPILSESSVRELLKPHWRYDGGNGDTQGGFYCAYGLAIQMLPVAQGGCRDDLFGGARAMVGHAGDAYGLRSGMWVDRERGVGIAYFATGNGADPPHGRTAYREIEEWLAARLGR